MIGSSMMMASFGFMIYAISPAYSNSDKEKTEIKNTGISNAPVGTNGVIVGDYAYFVDGGNMYRYNQSLLQSWIMKDCRSSPDNLIRIKKLP